MKNGLAVHAFLFSVVAALQAAVMPLAYSSEELREKIRTDLAKELVARYPGARIEIQEKIEGMEALEANQPELTAESVGVIRILDENNRGEVRFQVGKTWLRAGVLAWVPAVVPTKRVLPGQVLSADLFRVQDVNVSSGYARDYRGVLLGSLDNIEKMEARQTLLEGQLVLQTAIQKTPEIRRGDLVRVLMRVGDLTVQTAGIAQEPASFDANVRVLTQKTKRELVGKLRTDKSVEVQL